MRNTAQQRYSIDPMGDGSNEICESVEGFDVLGLTMEGPRSLDDSVSLYLTRPCLHARSFPLSPAFSLSPLTPARCLSAKALTEHFLRLRSCACAFLAFALVCIRALVCVCLCMRACCVHACVCSRVCLKVSAVYCPDDTLSRQTE
jgi:hypothetical protein